MVEVNLNTVKCRSKHLQHHPAHEASQERIVGGEMYRKTEERKNEKRKLMAGDKEHRGTMFARE